MDALNDLHAASSFEEFDKMTDLNYLVESNANATGILDYSDDVPYLESLSSNGGVQQSDIDEIENKTWKSANCMLIAHKFTGYDTKATYFKFFPCLKWWCPKCGDVDGPIHKKRVARIINKIGADLKETVLRQIVFTIPQEYEQSFMSKAALNSLVKMSQKVVKKFFPGLKCVAALQLFGDRDHGRFRPHVHVIVFDKKGCLHVLPGSSLESMNDKWRRALQGYLRTSVLKVDIHVSFTTEPGRIKHRINYISRPCPGSDNYDAIQKNTILLNFIMNTLQRFSFIRYFNGRKAKKLKDATPADIKKEAIGQAGERLVYVPGESMTRTEFDLRYRKWDYTEISPGFYRINSS